MNWRGGFRRIELVYWILGPALAVLAVLGSYSGREGLFTGIAPLLRKEAVWRMSGPEVLPRRRWDEHGREILELTINGRRYTFPADVTDQEVVEALAPQGVRLEDVRAERARRLRIVDRQLAALRAEQARRAAGRTGVVQRWREAPIVEQPDIEMVVPAPYKEADVRAAFVGIGRWREDASLIYVGPRPQKLPASWRALGSAVFAMFCLWLSVKVVLWIVKGFRAAAGPK